MSLIYMDYAAATPLKPEVLTVMQPFFCDEFYNPSALYLPAKKVKSKLEDARRNVAEILGAKPSEVIFTSGATEANNLAIMGLARQFPKSEILISAVEHESVTAPASLFKARPIPVDQTGIILLDKLSNMINDRTILVSLIMVNNELGTIQNLAAVAKLIAKTRHRRRATGNQLPVYLHTDAAQAASYLDLHVNRLGVDLLSLNGGKIHGPKQSGILYVKTGVKLQPLMFGGGQEFGLRSGTENMMAIAGFSTALRLAQQLRLQESDRLNKLRENFEERLKRISDTSDKVIINGGRRRAPHIISAVFVNYDNERLMMELDEAGIICAAGSACSAGDQLPSRVLKAIGLSDDQAGSTLRFSLGSDTCLADIDKVIKVLERLLANR